MSDFEVGVGIRELRPDESFEWQRRIGPEGCRLTVTIPIERELLRAFLSVE